MDMPKPLVTTDEADRTAARLLRFAVIYYRYPDGKTRQGINASAGRLFRRLESDDAFGSQRDRLVDISFESDMPAVEDDGTVADPLQELVGMRRHDEDIRPVDKRAHARLCLLAK